MMKPRNILTAALLFFVLASVLFLVVNETRQGSEAKSVQGVEGINMDRYEEDEKASGRILSPADHKVIAYYFYGKPRCVSCRKIESYTDEAIRTGFGEALQGKSLEWHVIDIEAPGNEHFVDEYKLFTKAVVLVETRDGQQVSWKNLEKVWDLIYDKEAFMQYIRKEVKSYLGETG